MIHVIDNDKSRTGQVTKSTQFMHYVRWSNFVCEKIRKISCTINTSDLYKNDILNFRRKRYLLVER